MSIKYNVFRDDAQLFKHFVINGMQSYGK